MSKTKPVEVPADAGLETEETKAGAAAVAADMPADDPKKPKAEEAAVKSAETEPAEDESGVDKMADSEPAEGEGPTKMSMHELFMPKDVKKAVIKAAIALLVLVLIVIAVFGVLIYGYKSESPVVKAVAQEIPYPVGQVNGRFESYFDYLFEVDANKRAYQNNAKLNNQQPVDFSSTDGKKLVVEIKKHVLDQLKSEAVTAQLADEKKIKITSKDVDNTINDLYKRYGGKDTLLKTLKQIYDWNLDDLKRVVYRQLQSKKLQDAVTGDPAMLAQAKAKAQSVLNQVKAGGDFVALAKKYSQASDASSGGDLGSITKSQLPSDIQKAIDAVQVGQVSDLIKTQYGYEIIKVTAKDGDTIKGNHILIKTTDFTEYFNEQLKKAKSTVFIKI